MVGAAVDSLNALPGWQATLVLLLVALTGAVALEKVGLATLSKLIARSESRFDDIVFQELRLPVVLTVFLTGVYLITRIAEPTGGLLGQDQLALFFGQPSLSVIVLVWAWGLNQTVNRIVDDLDEVGRHYEFAPVFSNIWTLAVLLTAGISLLSIWNIDITPLIGAAGVAGIAIGFAAKDTVANFFGGMALYFDDTYKLGDYVVLDSGEAGTVVKIGVRSTTILTRAEVLVTVPNARLNAGKVINESAPQRRKRIKLPIGVAYGTDIDAFEALVLDVAAADDLVLERPEPRIRFREFGSSALAYELLCWVPTPERAGKATHQLNRALYTALADAGIEIPYPRRDLTLRGRDTTDETDGALVPPDRSPP